MTCNVFSLQCVLLHCSVSETLEDVLQIVSDTKGKAKTPKVPGGMPSSQPEASRDLSLFDENTGDGGASDMGTEDIMKYIQQNQSTADDDLDLF